MRTDELREVVSIMRELGVLEAFGVKLGPEPPKADTLARKLEAAPEEARPLLEQELAEERMHARIAEARQEARDKLAGTGRDYSDEEIDRFLDPRVFKS